MTPITVTARVQRDQLDVQIAMTSASVDVRELWKTCGRVIEAADRAIEQDGDET